MPHLLLQERLDLRRLAAPEGAQVLACLQCLNPDSNTQAQCEGSADYYKPALGAEPASVRRKEEGWQREQESGKDEDSIDNSSGQWALAEKQILGDVVYGCLLLHSGL